MVNFACHWCAQFPSSFIPWRIFTLFMFLSHLHHASGLKLKRRLNQILSPFIVPGSQPPSLLTKGSSFLAPPPAKKKKKRPDQQWKRLFLPYYQTPISIIPYTRLRKGLFKWTLAIDAWSSKTCKWCFCFYLFN